MPERGKIVNAATICRITRTPGICGGRACVAGHRVPVWGLVRYRQIGLADAKILEAYPSIAAADLEAAWEYYKAHSAEIDRDIADNENEGD
jgi:uncharacterized protein (DUF433 family)